ncbi:MAG: SDR family oxidoreductase [Actinomycetota bacterium]|nr:SDR family oxidoreductase [Actinomycetota bacterium]
MPRALVTGGAGFLGSHLCDRLIKEGWEVVCFDNLITGAEDNLAHLTDHLSFSFENRNVIEHLDVDGAVDWVMHLASPASPPDYFEHPIHTMKVNSIGTMNALGLAKAKGAKFFLTSTSEAYGDPLVHPQPESYWGNVNPVGPRGVYDEGKRFAEAMTMAYHREHGVDVRIVRIFNTYGSRMRRRDGRAVPNFIDQALKGEQLTVHGDGSQTRSLCYVDDEIEGFWRFINSDHTGPMNIGNPHEVTILKLAETIAKLAGSGADVTYMERPVDDPEVRCPDIGLARRVLGWQPQVSLEDGLQRTIDWARTAWL